MLYQLLTEELEVLGLTPDNPPNKEEWHQFLMNINRKLGKSTHENETGNGIRNGRF